MKDKTPRRTRETRALATATSLHQLPAAPVSPRPRETARFTRTAALTQAATAKAALPPIEYVVASLRALKPADVDAEAAEGSIAGSTAGSTTAGASPTPVTPAEARARLVANAGGGGAKSSAKSLVRTPKQLFLNGEPVVTTPRFWWSLFMRCGLNEAVFRYFDPGEVFQRVAKKDAGRSVRFAIESPAKGLAGGAAGPRRLLAVSAPSGPLLGCDAAAELVDNYSGHCISYSNGVLSAMHTPVHGDKAFHIGPDEFKHRFHLEVPVDGLGEPRIHVAMLRLVCRNGSIAMRGAFRSAIRIGKDPEHSLERALSHYSNDDGFSAMRQRYESAQRSWASLREVRLLEQELTKISWGATPGGAERRRAFRGMVGDFESRYGLASIEAISVKRQSMLQAGCRVYDLINFATEVATHHAPPQAASRLQAWLGGTISEEYDLENTANDVPDFVDVFTNPFGRLGGGGDASRN